MKGVFAAVLSFFIFVFCSGCQNYPELYERMLIQAIGVDVSEKGYKVSVRAYSADEENKDLFFTGEGVTVLEAIDDIGLSSGLEPFYAHNSLVVFGADCAKGYLEAALDFFIRYYNTRPAVKMFLSEGTAEEILGAKKDDKLIPVTVFRELSENGGYSGKALGTDVLEFVNGITREGSSPYLPVLKAEKDEVKVSSTAVMKGYELKDMLELEDTRGIIMIRFQIEEGDVTVSTESLGNVTLSVATAPAKITVESGNENQPRFSVFIEARADISSVSRGGGEISEKEASDAEEALSEALKKNAESAIEKAIVKNGCDIFGFGNFLFRERSEVWREISSSWDTLMKECEYTVTVKSRVLTRED